MSSETITRNDLKNILNNLIPSPSFTDFFYPVGSYYETSDTTFDPNVSWGGTWVLELEGMVHVSAGAGYTVNGATQADGVGVKDSGNKDAIVPTHTHSVGSLSTATTSKTLKDTTATLFTGNQTASTGGMITSTKTTNRQYKTDGTSDNSWQKWTVDATHSHTINGFTVPTPSNASALENANMPPYIVVNRWHRTA